MNEEVKKIEKLEAENRQLMALLREKPGLFILEALKAMLDRNELGVKTGKGFYTYPDPEYSEPGFLKG